MIVAYVIMKKLKRSLIKRGRKATYQLWSESLGADMLFLNRVAPTTRIVRRRKYH